MSEVPNAPRLGIVRAVAWDAAGNKSMPASPALAVHSAGATARAQIASNRSGPPARRAAGLREAERSDSGEKSEGRRRAGAGGALRAACTAGGTPGPSPAPRPRGRPRRLAGRAREALRAAAAVPRRVVVLDLAAPARRQRLPRRRAAPAGAPLRAARRGPPRGARRRPGAGGRGSRASRRARRLRWPRSRRPRRRSSCSSTRFDFSFEEIAGAEGMPVGTAKCHAHRGRNGLRERLSA